MSDESVRAQVRDERVEDLPAEVRGRIEKSIRDGVSFGISPRSARGRRRVTSIRWNPGDVNPLAQAILDRVEEDEMPLYIDGVKFLIRQAVDGETETR